MKQSRTSASSGEESITQQEIGTAIWSHSPWQTLLRGVWLVIAGLALFMFVVGSLIYFNLLRTIATETKLLNEQLFPEEALALWSLGVSPLGYALYRIILEILFFVPFYVIGVIIFWRKSDTPIALLISLVLIAYGAQDPSADDALATVYPGWYWVTETMQALGLGGILVITYLFPDGNFVPRWTRSATLVWTVLIITWLIIPSTPGNPIYEPQGVGPTLFTIVFNACWYLTGIYALLYRYWRVASPPQRQQTKWVLFGFTMAFCGGFAFYLLRALVPFMILGWARYIDIFVGEPILLLCTVMLPISFGVSILRYHLWSIDIIIKRTLVYSTLTTSVVAIYMLIVGFLSVLFQSRYNNIIISLIGTGLVAVLFQPLRERLQRRINWLLYGDRKDPYAILSQLSHRLGAAIEPQAVLPIMVKTISESLMLPYVAITLASDNGQQRGLGTASTQDFKIAAEYGKSTNTSPVCLPLTYQGLIIGQLLIIPHINDEPLMVVEQRILADIAHQAGVAVYTVHLMEELQKAREQLVFSREEERRRLHFDLHDSLGAQLASQKHMLTASLKVVSHDPDAAKKLIVDAIENTQTALANIRRMINELRRPPDLDQLGFVPALREQINQHRSSSIKFILDLPELSPILPAAIEVACYRILQEAVTNVVNHANAFTCRIKLTVSSTIDLEICDDGQGKVESYQPGVGLTSMRTRVEELGGKFKLTANQNGGTCVHVQIPLS